MQIIWNTYLRGRFGGWKGTFTSRLVNAAAITIPVLAGVFMMSKEPLLAFTSSIARYEAAYRQSLFFTL